MKVVNPTKSYYPNATKSYIEVVDTKSAFFKTSMSDQWSIRIYQQYLDCVAAGGKVIFATFTYNEFCLPRYHWTQKVKNEETGEISYVDRSMPRFSKRDKDRFLNSLRKHWENLGVTGFDCEQPFKYVWANEIGPMPNRTHRPHYHILFFIPKEILDIEGTDEQHWKDLLQDFWRPANKKDMYLGDVRWSPDESIFVNREFACLYTSKYMFKTDDYLLNPDIKDYFEEYGELPSDGKKKGWFTSHWQSHGIGSGLIDKCNNEEAFVYGLDLHMPSEVQSGEKVRHKVPLYIERKLCCDFDKQTLRYIINERGCELQLARFKNDVLNGKFKYRIKYCNEDWLRSSISEEEFKNSKVLGQFYDYEDFIKFLHNIDSRNPEFLEEVILYNKVWRGMLIDEDTMTSLYSVDKKDFVDFSYKQYLRNLRKDLDFVNPLYTCELGVFKGSYIHGEILQRDYNGHVVPVHQDKYFPVMNMERFYAHDNFLDICLEVKTIVSERKYKKYQKDKEKRREIKYKLKKCI